MKAYRGSRGMAPLILCLCARWSRGVTVAARPLCPGREPQHPLNKRLGGPQTWYGCFAEEKNLISCRIWTPAHLARSLVPNRLYMGILQNKPLGVLKVKMDALQVEGTFIQGIWSYRSRHRAVWIHESLIFAYAIQPSLPFNSVAYEWAGLSM
jgi:hypothetical protein